MEGCSSDGRVSHGSDVRVWSAEEEITEFLEPLLARLSEVLGRRGSVESQLSALGAISSAAAAARTGFRPYAAAVLPLLRSYMNITEVSVDSLCPSSRLLKNFLV